MWAQVASASAVYRQYRGLMRFEAQGLGGQLLLAVQVDGEDQGQQLDPRATEVLVRAANIAGAGTLLVCAEEQLEREQVRSGICDFLVTNLDEALRILKNELRRRQPVAVCLPGHATEILGTCVERGVQPQLMSVVEPTLQARGARLLDLARRSVESAEGLEPVVTWSVQGERMVLAAVDALAMAATSPARRSLQQRWLSGSPQYLGRALSSVRVMAMARDEADRFVEAARHGVEAGELPAGVRIESGDQVLLS